MASIELERARTAWTDRGRAYKVVIDGEVVGKIRRGEMKAFEVSPGRHAVQLRIDWATSEAVEVDAAEGRPARLVCHGRSPSQALYSSTFGRRSYVVLEPAPEA